jgi:hypothetical protein
MAEEETAAATAEKVADDTNGICVAAAFYPGSEGLRRALFLRSINLEEFVAIHATGKYIKHFQYGCGVVTESGDDRTTIDFDTHGIKKFVTSLMVIEAAEGIPPKRRRAKRVKAVKPAPTLSGPVFVPGAK